MPVKIADQLAIDASNRYDQLRVKIDNYRIQNEEEFGQLANMLTTVKAEQKRIDQEFDPQIKELYEPLEKIYASKRRSVNLFKEAEVIIKKKMADWQLERRKIQLEEERKKQLQIAEQNRIRENALAEIARISAAKKAEEEAKEQQKKNQSSAEQLKRQQEADRKLQEAHRQMQQAETQVIEQSVKPVAAPSKATGVKTQFEHVVTAIEEGEFLCGVIDGVIPPNMIMPHLQNIKMACKENWQEVAKWPGVTVEERAKISSR